MNAVPCVLCGTEGGDYRQNTHRPARVNLTRYGVPGKACCACYATVRYRVKHGLDPRLGRAAEGWSPKRGEAAR